MPQAFQSYIYPLGINAIFFSTAKIYDIDARTSYAAFAASFLSAVKAASESYPILHGNITRLRQTFRIPHFIAYRVFLRRCFGVPIPQIPLRRCTRKPKPELDRLGTHLI